MCNDEANAKCGLPPCGGESAKVPRLAQNVVDMRRSGIREIMDLAASVPDAIHLEVGDPNFPTPPHIIEAAHRAAIDGFTHYTANVGLLSLREKLATKLQVVNHLEVAPANIVVSAGAVCAIASAVAAIAEPGDEILIPDPGWPNYQMMALMNHCTPRHYTLDAEAGFSPQRSQLEREITPRTKAIIINTPSNPSGAVFSSDTVQMVVELARKHDLFVISDEVYEQIMFDGEHVSALAFDVDGRVIGVYGFSKTYAMTGWRLGYLVASPQIAAAAGKLQEPLVSCACAVSQKAGEAALEGPQDCVVEMCSAYRRRRDLAADLLTRFGVPYHLPFGAFYMLVDVSAGGMDSYRFAKELLRQTSVAVAPGDTFGPSLRQSVRLSLATADEQLCEGVNRLSEFLSRR